MGKEGTCTYGKSVLTFRFLCGNIGKEGFVGFDKPSCCYVSELLFFILCAFRLLQRVFRYVC